MRLYCRASILFFAPLQSCHVLANRNTAKGVDESWPMQHSDAVTDHPEMYREYMKGCKAKFGRICEDNEADRISMNLAQPAFQKNFTSAGYAKVDAPFQTFELLRDFFERGNHRKRIETWERGNVHMNYWESGSFLVRLDDHDGSNAMPPDDLRCIVEEVQTVLERWSGVPLTFASLYGIRVYQNGAILAPHVDRLPLVISAIINVAQDVDEEWPLEVIGHDGVAVNVTLEPGEMILYESSSVIHGRPYPLNGRFYANLFLHLEPVGYTYELESRMKSNSLSAKEKFESALQRRSELQELNEHVPTYDLPSHIKEGTEDSVRWRQEFVFIREEQKKLLSSGTDTAMPDKDRFSSRTAHGVAANGDLAVLRRLAKANPSILQERDTNGWQPIHEAARSGQTRVIEYLIGEGVDLNARTNNGTGATPLWWAEHMLPNTHPCIKLLRKHGAKSIGPHD